MNIGLLDPRKWHTYQTNRNKSSISSKIWNTRLAIKKTVKTNYAKWRAHGTIPNLYKENSGKRNRVRRELNIEVLRILKDDAL